MRQLRQLVEIVGSPWSPLQILRFPERRTTGVFISSCPLNSLNLFAALVLQGLCLFEVILWSKIKVRSKAKEVSVGSKTFLETFMQM